MQLSSLPLAPQILSWRYIPGFSLFKFPTSSLLIFLMFQMHGSYFLISSTQLVFPGNIQMIECWPWLFVSPSCHSIKSLPAKTISVPWFWVQWYWRLPWCLHVALSIEGDASLWSLVFPILHVCLSYSIVFLWSLPESPPMLTLALLWN